MRFQCRCLYERGKSPVYSNASVKYFPLGEDKFQELSAPAWNGLRSLSFWIYFIVDKGIMWNRILRIRWRARREKAWKCDLCMMAPVHCPFCREITRNVWNNWVSSAKSLHRCDRFYLRIRITGIIERSRYRWAGSFHRRRGIWQMSISIEKNDSATGRGSLPSSCREKRSDSFTLMFLQLWNINVKEKEDYSKYMQYTSVIDTRNAKWRICRSLRRQPV